MIYYDLEEETTTGLLADGDRLDGHRGAILQSAQFADTPLEGMFVQDTHCKRAFVVRRHEHAPPLHERH